MNKFNAICALRPNARFSIEDDVVMNWTEPDGKDIPTDTEINDKIAELQAEYDSQEYVRTRAPLYPPIGDQLDDLYKKGAFSDEMAAKIKKVKDDNPKS